MTGTTAPTETRPRVDGSGGTAERLRMLRPDDRHDVSRRHAHGLVPPAVVVRRRRRRSSSASRSGIEVRRSSPRGRTGGRGAAANADAVNPPAASDDEPASVDIWHWTDIDRSARTEAERGRRSAPQPARGVASRFRHARSARQGRRQRARARRSAARITALRGRVVDVRDGSHDRPSGRRPLARGHDDRRAHEAHRQHQRSRTRRSVPAASI